MHTTPASPDLLPNASRASTSKRASLPNTAAFLPWAADDCVPS